MLRTAAVVGITAGVTVGAVKAIGSSSWADDQRAAAKKADATATGDPYMVTGAQIGAAAVLMFIGSRFLRAKAA